MVVRGHNGSITVDEDAPTLNVLGVAVILVVAAGGRTNNFIKPSIVFISSTDSGLCLAL